jgi:mono/diheme cytochrome c family protein
MCAAIATVILVALASHGCAKKPRVPPEQRAREVFDSTCSTCHGDGGRGDGPAARALAVKPRDYTNRDWQHATTDDQIRAIIVKGGAGVGKSALMPATPQLADEAGVVDALVAIVRSFGSEGSR